MKYEVIKTCRIKGEAQKVGAIVELDERLATELMAIGRVAPAPEGAEVENRAVGLKDSKPKAKPRTRKAKAAPKVD